MAISPSLNPESSRHPHYDITAVMRSMYPQEILRWEQLLQHALDPAMHGCFTCRYYTPRDNGVGFIDVQMVDGHPLPWDTEEAWVWCDRYAESDTALQINCPVWKNYSFRKIALSQR